MVTKKNKKSFSVSEWATSGDRVLLRSQIDNNPEAAAAIKEALEARAKYNSTFSIAQLHKMLGERYEITVCSESVRKWMIKRLPNEYAAANFNG
jgi:hypothetical protein